MFARGSIYLFKVAGTDVRVHWTFFLLLAWLGAVYWQQGGMERAIWGVTFISILFFCVLLHEFGHIFAARRYGIKSPDVTLLPIGGVAALERMPRDPGQEIVVALAGPAVNLVIAGAIYAALGGNITLAIAAPGEIPGSFWSQIAIANLVLVVFNLIPAFPMDGGRVLRALIAMATDYRRATTIAARIGQVLAVGFLLLGLMGNVMLVLVALFIFLAAQSEANQVAMSSAMSGHQVRDAMIDRFDVLRPADTLATAVDKLLQTTQQEFPVVDQSGRLRGVLTRTLLVKGLKGQGEAALVHNVMTTEVPMLEPHAPLELAQRALPGAALVAVIDANKRFVGYINRENLMEFFMVDDAQR